MSKLKLSILTLLLVAAAGLAYVFIPTHVRLSSEILNKSIGDGFKVVGYKAVSTEPKDGKLNHFFLIAEGSDVKDAEPFLITSDMFIKVERTSEEENKLKVELKGRVKAFDNDQWITKPDGSVHHWFLSLDAEYNK
ncbi:hypothetical protein [Vibrio maerlii]|uniref:hypothetical protein n=1 Tax=Vibrio maerlii TaxID=2231648 RepID=UPI000E3C8135|nr:hypothetical protein [Vibrio maerlii]